VVALADGVVIRVVNDFKFSMLDKINYKDDSYDVKIKNLDLLR
jgi:hypothetical protein